MSINKTSNDATYPVIHGAGGGGGGGSSQQKSQPKAKPPRAPIIAQDDTDLKGISFAKLQFLLCEGEGLSAALRVYG